MKFEVLRESIKRALAVVLPAVATKSTLPVLYNILLTANNDGLTLAGTNLETSISTSIGAKTDAYGSTTLPGKLLNELIGGLPNVPIAFELNERNQETTITAPGFKTTIKGIEADEYPALATTGGDVAFSMPVVDWHVVASVVAPRAASDAQPVLSGVHIAGKSGVIFEATTQYYLGRKTFDLDMVDVDTIIPASSLTMARKVFSGDEDVSFSMVNSGNLALLSDGVTKLTSRVIDGQYPDLDRIIPMRYTTRLVVPAGELLAALKLARPFAEASSNIVRLDVAEIGDMSGKLGIAATAAAIGQHSASLDVIASGQPTQIALNVNYLIEAVSACGAGELAIELQSSNHPAILKPVGDESMLQLVMPMTVR